MLLDSGIVAKNVPLKDAMIVVDLEKAYEAAQRCALKRRKLTLDLVRGMTEKALKNSVEGEEDARFFHDKSDSLLAFFCMDFNERLKSLPSSASDDDKYRLSFDARDRLAKDKPWVAGNGRMSRLLMHYLQLELGLTPSALECVREASTGGQKALAVGTTTTAATAQEPKAEAKHQEADGVTGTADPSRKSSREIILDLIAKDPFVSSHTMAKTLGINRSAISKHLDKLKYDGVILRVGPDKGGHWEIRKADA